MTDVGKREDRLLDELQKCYLEIRELRKQLAKPNTKTIAADLATGVALPVDFAKRAPRNLVP